MAIASTFKVEIEDASLTWQDVTSSVSSLRDGTSSVSQIIPTISINWNIDADDVSQYLTPTVNPERARIRVTENTTTTYYLMEDNSGSVREAYPYPTTTGRAYCGRIVDFPLLTYVPIADIPMSALVRQITVENVASQSGLSIPVVWLATQDPTVPGRRLEFNRQGRLEVLRDLAESCGAGVRSSATGLAFEIYDIPSKDLSASSSFDFDNALSLSYSEERIDKPLNAIRVKGAAFDYSIGKLPTIKAWCSPDSMPADGTSTSTAACQVYGANGIPVQQKFVTDEAIDADSFTTIPVSGCYAVTGVWLNDGTQSVPVRGDRVEPSTFNASTITVPDNGTDLFIVSYVQAESVSWTIEDYADKIIGEEQVTTGTLAVSSDENLGEIIGVYLASDTRRVGTNFFTGGSFTENTKNITLGISPGATGTAVLIDYLKYNASPLTGLNISPTSSLCNENGIAETTVGAGTAIGTGFIVASSLGQQGYARLSLSGTGVGSMTLDVDKARIRRAVEDQTIVNTYTSEVGTVAIDGTGTYILVDNPIYYVSSIFVTGDLDAYITNWENSGSNYKVYINTDVSAGTSATVSYSGYTSVSEDDKTAKITATLKDSDGDLVTDGTTVYFELTNRKSLGCILSAESANTVDGVCSVNLTSGSQVGTVTVQATSGGYHAEINVEITDEDETGGNVRVFGNLGGWSWLDKDLKDTASEVLRRERTGKESCKQVQNDDNDADGSVSGSRRLVDCDGNPLPRHPVTFNGVTSLTDSNGWFSFANGSAGTNTLVTGGKSYSFSISARNSANRGGYRAVCTDNETGVLTYEGNV